MKVYFSKENPRNYQIFPEPNNLDDFVEWEIEDALELDRKVMVTHNGQYKFVENPPSSYHSWNGDKWIINEEAMAEIKASAWERIKEKRYQNGLGGVYIERVGKWFQTGEEEKTKYLGLDKVIDLLGEVNWKCYDNSFIKMDRTLLNEIFAQMVQTENADHINAEKHRLAMLASDDPLNYDFSTGWSAIYEG
ncbi:DUF4376 domain-containing protein [Pasteurella sp. PK-2025]|uniref:DUF4376 domain-containing protein n=1 Tax=unclassified Pasteurella TaxID=2621516 RepID=UPI003C76CDB6